MRRRARKPFKNFLPDTTALADLTLILLCFFLECGYLKDFNVKEVEVPLAVPSEGCTLLDGEIAYLNIVVDKEEKLFLELYPPRQQSAPTIVPVNSLDELDKILFSYTHNTKDNPEKIPAHIFLKADKETKSGVIGRILGILQSREINKISFIINAIKPFPKEIFQRKKFFNEKNTSIE